MTNLPERGQRPGGASSRQRLGGTPSRQRLGGTPSRQRSLLSTLDDALLVLVAVVVVFAGLKIVGFIAAAIFTGIKLALLVALVYAVFRYLRGRGR